MMIERHCYRVKVRGQTTAKWLLLGPPGPAHYTAFRNEKIKKGNRRVPQTHSRKGGRRVSPAWNRHDRHSRSDGCGRLNAWWILPAFRLQGTTRGRGYSRRS